MIYTATANQFGGAMSGRVFGDVFLPLNGGTPPPCTACLAILGGNPINSTGMGWVGNAFGVVETTPGTTPQPGWLIVTALANGLITNSTSSGNAVTTTFKPTKTGTYKFAVDSASTATSGAGNFTIQIK